MQVVREILFGFFQNSDFFIQVVDDFFKRLFEVGALVEMFVSQGLILLLQVINFELGFFLF